MTTLGKELLQAAKEARAIARGEADPSTYRVFVPSDIDVAAIRKRLKMTQVQFANTFGLPLTTLRDWEQGRVRPDSAARSYLLVISRNPEAVEQALHAA
jgi:putative transcriptional regulator